MAIAWYTSADALISTDNIDTVTTTAFVRFNDNITSPGTAAYFKMTLQSTANGVFVFFTDVMAEENSALSEYMPSQDVTFAIEGNTTFSSDITLEVDMEKRTVRYFNASIGGAWTNCIDDSNAQFFRFIPGKNMLAFSNEADVNSVVRLRYTNKYLAR